MAILPSAPVAAQEKYRIQAGTGSSRYIVEVEVLDGLIVVTPAKWYRWLGKPLHELEWWLTAKYGTAQKRRVGV